MEQKRIERAKIEQLHHIREIVHTTIQEIYPKYYPKGAVQFFKEYHKEEAIKQDIEKENIFYIEMEQQIIGTGTINKNEIGRLFILPQFQGQGYGSILMDELEKIILDQYHSIRLDASFPAQTMYLKRGYQFVSYEKIACKNGQYLCYHRMEKVRE